ncbi:MAG: hypothetical protein ACOYN4_00410 [Bacteroidales bacterium]
MAAFNINPAGYGFTAQLPENKQFFWSQVSANAYCREQLVQRIRKMLETYIASTEFHGIYNTIRKHNAFETLKAFAASTPQELSQLAAGILALENDFRATIPSATHPNRHLATKQVNDIIWLCVRVRKQFKIQT